MINVFWLPSWFPSIESPQNGDFIERHSFAIAKFTNLTILFVQSSSKVNNNTFFDHKDGRNYFVRIILFRKNMKLRCFNFIYYFYFVHKQFNFLFKDKSLPKVIHVHVSYQAGLFALWIKLRYGIPFVLTEHWTFFTKERIDNYNTSNFVFRYILKIIFNNASYVLPVSENLNKQLKGYFPKIKSKVIPNVVNPDLFYYESNVKKSNFFHFIHVSSLNTLKNPLILIRTFCKLKLYFENIKFDIVGPASKEFVEEVRDLGYLNDFISFLGLKKHNEVAGLMREASAFVLFSSSENLPCVIAESLCCGVPVISSAVGGVPEMIDESNGILVPPGDEDALYNAMEAMILNYNKYDRRKISESAQAKYNPEVVGKQIVEVYEKVLSKK